MKIRAIVVPAVLILVLSGCAPEPVVPSSTPTPSVTTPSATPTATPSVSSLALPEDCEAFVPLPVIHKQFSEQFESIYFAADLGDSSAQSFAARDGLTCAWGIPQSDAGYVLVFAAERETATDAQQVAKWQSAGYTDCSPFLDACYSQNIPSETGVTMAVHLLLKGFEVRIEATTTSLDPLMVVAGEVAKNMGYV